MDLARKCSILLIFTMTLFAGCSEDPVDNPPAGDPPDDPVIDSAYEGYGAITTGGADGEVWHVTHLGDSGEGSLRYCVGNRTVNGDEFVPRTIVFDVGGEIRLLTDLRISTPYLTIDGSTAPYPGITIRKATDEDGEIRINTGSNSSAHDIIVTHLRFDGEWDMVTEAHSQNSATISLDGEDYPGELYNIVFDHITCLRGTDASPDLWGEIHNVTIQWSIFYNCLHPTTISHSGGIQERRNITLHHNVYAKNDERNPQIRGRVSNLELINNIVYDWKIFDGGYGVRLRERDGVYPTDINVINNFYSSPDRPGYAFILGEVPGDEPNPYPGNVYLSGNHFPPENVDNAGTVGTPISVAAYAQVTTHTLGEMLSIMLQGVGTHYRTAEEQSLIDEISAAMQSELE
jgi:hypothetical protein